MLYVPGDGQDKGGVNNSKLRATKHTHKHTHTDKNQGGGMKSLPKRKLKKKKKIEKLKYFSYYLFFLFQ